MQKPIHFLTATLIAMAVTSHAYGKNPLPHANDRLEKYADVEDWTVYQNKTRGECLMVSEFDKGAVQMGASKGSTHLAYLGIFTKNDIGIRDGAKTPIFIAIDGNVYGGIATGVSGHLKGGYSGGYIPVDNPQFKYDVAKKHKMVVFPDTVGTFIVDLTGTYNAMKMVRKCLEK